MTEPVIRRRYNPPIKRPRPCAHCGGDVFAFSEVDYEGFVREGPGVVRFWHCRRCGAAAPEWLRPIPGAHRPLSAASTEL